jgi:hypothetical protein
MTPNRTIAAVIASAACFACASDSNDSTQVEGADTETQETNAVDIEELRARNDAAVSALVTRVRELQASDSEDFLLAEQKWNRQEHVSPATRLRKLAEQPLAEEEREAIETYLWAQGTNLDALTFSGRLIAQDDVLIEADRILAALGRPGEKSSLSEDGVSPNDFVRCGSGNPHPLGRVCPGGITPQFWRPNTDQNYVVVVPDGAALNFLKDMFITATAELENITGDCLNSDDFSVMTNTQWEALGVGRGFVHEITVDYGPGLTVCGKSTARACATSPQQQSVFVNVGVTQNRMAFGSYLGVNNAIITSNTEANRGTLMHELGHAMGLAHPPDEVDSAGVFMRKLYVPGTLVSFSVSSIMQSTGAAGRVQHPSADDIDTLRTLYPPGCSYSANFSNLVAN